MGWDDAEDDDDDEDDEDVFFDYTLLMFFSVSHYGIGGLLKRGHSVAGKLRGCCLSPNILGLFL